MGVLTVKTTTTTKKQTPTIVCGRTVTMTKKEDSYNRQDEEHHGFKQWLTSLSRDELIRAMVIRFQPSTAPQLVSTTGSSSGLNNTNNNNVGGVRRNAGGNIRSRSNKINGKINTKSSRTDGTANSNSHELDLLLEMVRLQSPRPTPVHPRAMGYRPRCTQSNDWARLDYYWREEEGLAKTRPRLFQWTPTSSTVSNNNNNNSNGDRSSISSLTTGGYSLDPELEQILAMAGMGTNVSTGIGKRNGVERKNHHSPTTKSSNKKNQNETATPASYNVVARNKVAEWGDVYGLGQTWEQQEADRFILEGTHLILDNATASARIAKNITTTSSSSNVHQGGEGQILSQMVSSACFTLPPSSASDDHTVSSIISMLQVASRGNLFRCPSILSDSLPSSLLSSDNEDIQPIDWDWSTVVASSWLQPTERWFGISQYLAFRYQMALLEVYHRHNQHCCLKIPPNIATSELDDGHNLWNKYESKMLDDALRSAVQMSLLDILNMERRDGVSSPRRFGTLRDSILWTLLNGETVDSYQVASTLYPNREGWNLLPLMDSRSSVHVQFRLLVRYNLDQQLAKEMAKAVSIQEEENQRREQAGIVSPSLQQSQSLKKIRRKKKTRRVKNSGHGSFLKRHPTNPLPAIIASEGESEEEESSDDNEDNKKQQRNDTPVWDFPKNGTRPRERNRNIIMALSILDEVIENVFAKVGLPPTPPFHQDDDKKINTKKAMKTVDQMTQDIQKKTNDSVIQSDAKKHVVNTELTPAMSRDDSSQKSPGVISFPIQPETINEVRRQQPMAWHVPARSTAFGGFSQDFYNPFGIGRNFIFDSQTPTLGLPGDTDEFLYDSIPDREKSIFYHIFDSNDEKWRKQDDEEDDDDENLMAASTAASISSSIVATGDELEDAVVEVPSDINAAIDDEDNEHFDSTNAVQDENCSQETASIKKPSFHSIKEGDGEDDEDAIDKKNDQQDLILESQHQDDGSSYKTPPPRSPSPEAPATPPPTLSPILVSLADLKEIKRHANKIDSLPPLCPDRQKPGSVPSSPVGSHKGSISQSWSREDLRMDISNTQGQQTKRSPEVQTYRSVAVKNLARPIASSKVLGAEFRVQIEKAYSRRHEAYVDADACARSETALEGYHDDHIHKFQYDETDNHSATKDETTTITSGVSHRVEVDAEPENEEIRTLREERNNWRDLCLTLGAEVSKLKAIIASQNGSQAAPSHIQGGYNNYPIMYGPGSYDPHGMQPFFYGMKASGMRPGPMSDAGFHRGGDYESQVSEDEVYDSISKAREAQVDSVRMMSSSQTVAGSDMSVDFNTSSQALDANPPRGIMPVFDSVSIPFHGLQSRLSQDILGFVQSCNKQLSKLDSRRKLAIERFSRLVKTIWPRAQIKPFGSYVSGLCLPSSDMDFVISLPAVHKKDVALAPGVLEGRNAINESSQKLLARELKGESWIDPRSIKLIERTVVPVIKVCTKDSRARVIQLDISFDSPEHHGLEASRMILSILEELPMIRPLMLVLKQFLLDRSLLTAYTGGLSSYCLFLMLARYLQEQPASNSDCGSLLMGFLDFHGNSFDPRATGISVRRRQYFLRSNYGPDAGAYPQSTTQPMWTNGQQHIVANMPPVVTAPSNRSDFRRHNSFSESGSVDGSRRQHHRFQPASTSSFRFPSSRPIPSHSQGMRHSTKSSGRVTTVEPAAQQGSGSPMFDFTFDPLFVEDPLSASNNVGRNAFRINQVQRVFSDAHRALVASLDWDINSSANDGEAGDYPLLKCLLQGEDVLYEL